MAEPRVAQLVKALPLGPETRLLTFALPEGEIGFAGGQYIIVNTRIELPGGKLAKRAYSILSGDAEQKQFQIAVRRIGSGPGSNFMHGIAEGAELEFSGPWGKFVANGAPVGPRLVFATDTGITAGLGLLQGHGSRTLADVTTAVWFIESDSYFLPPGFARESLLGLVREFRIAAAPRTTDSTRIASAIAVLDDSVASTLPSSAFLAGDGALIHPLRERLVAAGMKRETIRLEAFFNNPERRVQS
ncbi:MAG: FAD-dependent oxidoreductase [Candidatus Binataceae bacterium]|nr:FAD-dependent oxidoreductase [Candidatus Binataceae bacterium]